MIRLVDYEDRPIWINPKRIDTIKQSGVLNTKTNEQSSIIVYHSGGSCCQITMSETLDEVKKLIDEALG